MSDAGAPRPRGRHSSSAVDASGIPTSWMPAAPGPLAGGDAGSAVGSAPWNAPAGPPAPFSDRDDDTAAWPVTRPRRRADAVSARRGASGLLDRTLDGTGPVPLEWRHASGPDEDGGPDPQDPPTSRGGSRTDDGRHPSAPLPPPPPGAWSRLSRRGDHPDDAPTEAQPAVRPDDARYDDEQYDDEPRYDDAQVDDDAQVGDATDAHDLDLGWEDRTGGLEVIGANVDEDLDRRGGRRRRRARRAEQLHDDGHDDVHDDLHDDDLHDDDVHDDDIPLTPYRRRRPRRRPVAIVLSLLILAALVGGVVFGGKQLLGLFVDEDYTGSGTGTVDIRVQDGDTLSDIGRTLVSSDVIASVGPFVDAAEANADAMGIAAGVYRLHKQMSGAAALELMLQPDSRLFSRVTIPEGTIAASTLQRIADATGMPLADLQAAAANPAALGLPAYANGSLEGFLFPATYDIEPDQTAADVLSAMVHRTTQALDDLGVPEDQRLGVLTEASIVQAEASSTGDMAKVARVLDNRIATGMNLQLDTTVNYANGKTGLTTTPEDRANPSPYNTYVHPGLPPGPIGNPGEDAIRAVLSPADGPWLFFVVVNPDTGDTRFAVTLEEHQANVALFQQWLRDNPGN